MVRSPEHPRLRGDHGIARARAEARGGTPPPARGPLARDAGALPGARNTPACAGTTRRAGSTPARGAEHPRLRGDHTVTETVLPCESGTPPPARGPPHSGRRPAVRPRNTPACAGTTRPARPARCPGPEHPRLRGDHVSNPNGRPTILGTPPPARGPRSHIKAVRAGARNTPACAGTTLLTRSDVVPRAEHPRLRGDHVDNGCPRGRVAGTPPPARGPLERPGCTVGRFRNTPACAGTTLPDLRR